MFRSLRPIFTYVLCLLDVQLFVRKDLEGTGSILMHYWEIHNSNNSRASCLRLLDHQSSTMMLLFVVSWTMFVVIYFHFFVHSFLLLFCVCVAQFSICWRGVVRRASD